MIVLIANYYTKEGQDDAVAATLREMAAYCNSGEEPGCALYIVNRSLEDPRRFLLYEQYADAAAFEAHRENPEFQRLVIGKVVPLLASRGREIYDVVAE